jgi:ribose-phosphate pyrophosphokinase
VKNLRIFGLDGTQEFAKKVAERIGVELCRHEEEYFPDTEVHVRSMMNVRGADVFVIQSLYCCEKESVSEKVIKLLAFIGSLRDASAGRITAVIPYLAYARQDRKVESREGITGSYLLHWLKSMMLDRILTIDVHNLSHFQGSTAIVINTDHLEAKNLLARYVADNCEEPDRLCCMSPDIGGVQRTRFFRNSLSKMTGVDIPIAVLDKTHIGRVIQGHMIVGDVKGKLVVINDDMIASAKTMFEAKSAVERNGGEVWASCATHPLFVGQVNENLASFKRVIVTDTILPTNVGEALRQKMVVISVADLFAQAIKRIHEEDSISGLLQLARPAAPVLLPDAENVEIAPNR